MFITVFTIIALVVLLAIPTVHLFHRSLVRSELEGLASDCAHIRILVGNNAEALQFVADAEKAHALASKHFQARQLKLAEDQISTGYVNLRNARLFVLPDDDDDDVLPPVV